MTPWPPPLPAAAQHWPTPRRARQKMHWLQSEEQYRAYFGAVIAQHGEDALALISMSGKPALNPAPTRFFCQGLPMLFTGRVSVGEKFTEYLVPARAALLALDAGHVICSCTKKRPPADEQANPKEQE